MIANMGFLILKGWNWGIIFQWILRLTSLRLLTLPEKFQQFFICDYSNALENPFLENLIGRGILDDSEIFDHSSSFSAAVCGGERSLQGTLIRSVLNWCGDFEQGAQSCLRQYGSFFSTSAPLSRLYRSPTTSMSRALVARGCLSPIFNHFFAQWNVRKFRIHLLGWYIRALEVESRLGTSYASQLHSPRNPVEEGSMMRSKEIWSN